MALPPPTPTLRLVMLLLLLLVLSLFLLVLASLLLLLPLELEVLNIAIAIFVVIGDDSVNDVGDLFVTEHLVVGLLLLLALMVVPRGAGRWLLFCKG